MPQNTPLKCTTENQDAQGPLFSFYFYLHTKYVYICHIKAYKYGIKADFNKDNIKKQNEIIHTTFIQR